MPACLPPASRPPHACAVPLNTVVLYWEPTWKVALVLRGVATAKEVLYWLLVVAFPVSSWLQLFPALIYLKFSK